MSKGTPIKKWIRAELQETKIYPAQSPTKENRIWWEGYWKALKNVRKAINSGEISLTEDKCIK